MDEDLKVLKTIFESVIPVEIISRGTLVLYLLYGFFDAPGKGFESIILSKEGISLEQGS